MLKKLLTLSLVAVMLSVTAFASADVAVFTAAYAAEVSEEPVFSYDAEDIQYVTEITSAGTAKHEPVEELPTWSGEPAETIVGGTGTAEDPYLISDGAELAYFAKAVNGMLLDGDGNEIAANPALCAKLDRDINLAKVASPASTADKNNWEPFAISGYKGDFNGQGHNIYNYYYYSNASTNKSGGLFRGVSSGGSITNLNIIDAEAYFGTSASNGVTAESILCGGITGEYATSEKQPGVKNLTNISNVYVSGKVGLTTANPRCSIYGSIVGTLKNATVQNCISNVNVDFTRMNATFPKTFKETYSVSGSSIGIGGVIGVINHDQNYAAIRNLGNMGDIVAPKNRRVGGVVGTIANNYSDQHVAWTNLWNMGDVTAYGQVAGVAGFVFNPAPTNTKQARLLNCYNTGDVTAVQATNAHVGGVYTAPTAVTTGGYFYSTGDVKIAVTDAETGDVTESFDATCGLIVGGSAKNTTTNQIYRSDLKSKYTADTTTGTGKTVAEIQAMTASDIEAVLGTGFVADYGINNNLPILASQKATVVLDEETYEIASAKSLSVKAAEAGYVALEVAAIIEGTTLSVTPAGGEAYTVEVSEAGAILLPTNGATEITVSAAEGNRFLVKKASDLSLAALEATAIKATIANAESATIVLALYNKANNTLQAVSYAPNTEATNGKISAVIDLTGEDVAGCELRAYVWANGTLMPVTTAAEVLD